MNKTKLSVMQRFDLYKIRPKEITPWRPEDAYFEIRAACRRRPDLKYKTWPNGMASSALDQPTENYMGYCYVASNAFAFMVPGATIWHNDRGHFWNMIGGEIWDLTAEQFNYIYPYHEGQKCPKRDTLRVRALLQEVGA